MNTTSQLYFVKKPTMVSKRKTNKLVGKATIPTSDIVTRDEGSVIPFETPAAERLINKINKTRKRIAMHQKPIEMTPYPEMARQQIISKSIIGQQSALSKKKAEDEILKQKEADIKNRELVHLDAIRQIAPNMVNYLMRAVHNDASNQMLKAFTPTKEEEPKKVKKTKPKIEEVKPVGMYLQSTQPTYVPPKIDTSEEARYKRMYTRIYDGMTKPQIRKSVIDEENRKNVFHGFDVLFKKVEDDVIADKRDEETRRITADEKKRIEEATEQKRKYEAALKAAPKSKFIVVDDIVTPPVDDSEGSGLRGKGFFSNILKSVGKKIIDKVKDDPIGSIKSAIEAGKQAIDAGKALRDSYAQKTGQDTSSGGKLKIKKAHYNKLKKHYTQLHGAGWWDSFSQGFMLPFQALGEVL